MDNAKIYNMRTYMNDIFASDISKFISGSNAKTGYANLDAITSLYPGLYVLGAISSLGKTTFIHQMADQIAQNGTPVIYFSLEQSAFELASKSLSRITHKLNYETALTSLQIRKTLLEDIHGPVISAMREYDKYNSNITIVECSFSATIKDIEDFVNDYIKKNKVKPVVIIDYLQVIQPMDNKITTKDAVDQHVRRLKKLQVEHSIALIVISSLNRQNYLTQIDYESFKESGGIEYTADVVWGLQLQVLHDKVFDSQANINEKRQKVREAKASNPRKIELVCLKNRFGVSSYVCKFDYHPYRDLFIPDMTDIDVSNLESDKDGFVKIPDGFKLPFD